MPCAVDASLPSRRDGVELLCVDQSCALGGAPHSPTAPSVSSRCRMVVFECRDAATCAATSSAPTATASASSEEAQLHDAEAALQSQAQALLCRPCARAPTANCCSVLTRTPQQLMALPLTLQCGGPQLPVGLLPSASPSAGAEMSHLTAAPRADASTSSCCSSSPPSAAESAAAAGASCGGSAKAEEDDDDDEAAAAAGACASSAKAETGDSCCSREKTANPAKKDACASSAAAPKKDGCSSEKKKDSCASAKKHQPSGGDDGCCGSKTTPAKAQSGGCGSEKRGGGGGGGGGGCGSQEKKGCSSQEKKGCSSQEKKGCSSQEKKGCSSQEKKGCSSQEKKGCGSETKQASGGGGGGGGGGSSSSSSTCDHRAAAIAMNSSPSATSSSCCAHDDLPSTWWPATSTSLRSMPTHDYDTDGDDQAALLLAGGPDGLGPAGGSCSASSSRAAAAAAAAAAAGPTPRRRKLWYRAAIFLAAFTIGWNLLEGASSILFGMKSDTLSLVGFGADSLVEVASASISLFILLTTRQSLLRGGMAASVPALKRLRVATITIGALLLVLGLAAVGGAAYRLVTRGSPNSSITPMIVSGISLCCMLVLWFVKLRAANALDSTVLKKDAACSLGCVQLSAAVLIGSVLFYVTHDIYGSNDYWWPDAVVMLELGRRIALEGFGTIREARKDTFDGTAACCDH